MKKQVLALVVLTAVGLWLSVGSASAADAIKIGVIYPLTGPNAAAGNLHEGRGGNGPGQV